MAQYTFLGECPASMKPVFIESYKPIPTHSETIVTYADGSVSSFNIVGEISGQGNYHYTTQIPNLNDATEIDIGTNVTSIGDNAFNGNSSNFNFNIKIPDSVTAIGSYAYNNNLYSGTLKIPDSVITIGDNAFSQSYIIVEFGNSVQTIGNFALEQIGNTSITFPESIVNLGYVFFYNDQLNSVTFLGKTIAQVQAMTGYDFGIHDKSAGNSGEQVTVNCSDGSFIITASCILKGTGILLADGTTKKIEDLTYDDVLKVWDFDEGQLSSAKVCWLTRPELKSNHYYQLTFDNGTVLKTTGINSNHRIFSVDQGKFTNVCDAKVGDKVFSIDGTLTITNVKYIEEECEYYNVMTSGKVNCFANGILTSDRYGNLYPIQDMKYVKDGRAIRPYSEYEAVGIDKYWYDNLRLGENTETVEKSKEYVWKCLGQMLPLPAQS